MNKIAVVKNLEDLEKLRKYTNVDKLTIFLLNDIYFALNNAIPAETKRSIFDILENVVNREKNIINFIKYFKIKPLVNF